MYRAHHKQYIILNIIFMSLLLCTSAHALHEDCKEKIHITADSSIYNYKTGMTIFEGHVKADQGSTHIVADKLTTKTNHHRIEEIIAYGTHSSLAHCTTLPKINDTEMQAHAKIIKFYPLKSDFIFEQNVTIIHGENSFQGQQILYNRTQQTIIVPETQQGRSKLVYTPDSA